MSLLFKLAWRNLWRNKRRTLLTIGAIAFSTFLTVLFRGIAIGTWDYNVSQTVEMLSGYLQIQRSGYNENPTLQKSLPYPGRLQSLVQEIPEVGGQAPRILADGLVSYKHVSAGTALFGIDPEAERTVSRFHERIRSGTMLSAQSGEEAVLGATLMQNLGAQIGDTVVILAQGYDGVMGNQRYRITGTLKMGAPEIDAGLVLIHLRSAQELLAMEGRANVIALNVRSLHDVESARGEVDQALAAGSLNGLKTLTWEEVMPELEQAMEFDIANDNIFMGILIIIASFGILNTILMSVTERFREFGVVMAMGMESGMLVRLVVLETVFIALVGIVAGAVPGYALNAYLAFDPIVLTGEFADAYEEYGFVPLVLGSYRIAIPLTAAIAVFVISLLASVYPAIRVARLEPLGGIRHT